MGSLGLKTELQGNNARVKEDTMHILTLHLKKITKESFFSSTKLTTIILIRIKFYINGEGP